MSASVFSLDGKTAIVTGASRGLGQAIAQALAQAGAQVCVTARSLSALEETREKVERAGRPCFAAAQDVRDSASIAPTIDAFSEKCGKIDILVNNAGFEHVAPSTDVDEALWDSIVDTNLKGAFFWSQAIARDMARRKAGGSIVNLCSLSSFVGIPTAVAYTSSKSGLLGMTRARGRYRRRSGVPVQRCLGLCHRPLHSRRRRFSRFDLIDGRGMGDGGAYRWWILPEAGVLHLRDTCAPAANAQERVTLRHVYVYTS